MFPPLKVVCNTLHRIFIFRMKNSLIALLLFAIVPAFAGDTTKYVSKPVKKPKTVKTASGLEYSITAKGNGPKPKRGDRVTVHYTGMLDDGTKFDSSVEKGIPFTFRLGTAQVISGWDEAFQLLRAGDKAHLEIPSYLAYGNAPNGLIPANAKLFFDVELVNVAPGPVFPELALKGAKRFPGYVKHPSGVYYKNHKSGKEAVAVADSSLLILEILYTTEKDSVFQPYSGEPQMLVVGPRRYKGDFMEMARSMKPGDSTTFKLRCDSLMKHTAGLHLPDFLHPDGYVGFVARLDSVISADEFKSNVKKHRDEQNAQEALVRDDALLLQRFLSDNKITQQPSPTGVYYIEQQAGTGENVKPGQNVKLHYKGYFLNGNVFDQSNKTPQSQPVEFAVGVGRLIPGFEEGLYQMKKGGKGIIIIPAAQGYGDGLTRVFEIEIFEIK